MADQLNELVRLTRDAILRVEDLPLHEVAVPEWGGMVLIRAMTGGERDRFEAAWKQDPSSDIRARLAQATLCNPAGDLIFKLEDVPSLSAKSSKALDRIFTAATIHNGITDRDVEELRKN